MSAPLIGITMGRTTSRNNYPVLVIVEAYVQAILRTGACPVMIPLGLPGELFDELLSRLDGVLFTGGGDVHPDQYGNQIHPKVNEVDRDRDRVELGLFQETRKRELPILGVCRGFQVINIGLGGTLYEDIQDQRPASLDHHFWPGHPRDYLAHPVEIAEDSRLRHILGKSSAPVNSLHHQGIRDLAPGLLASAIAPDGLIEALEMPDYPFGIAVQWHPEWLPEEASMDDLFRAFVQAAAERRRIQD